MQFMLPHKSFKLLFTVYVPSEVLHLIILETETGGFSERHHQGNILVSNKTLLIIMQKEDVINNTETHNHKW